MNPAILSMLRRYKCVTAQDYENAFKEIMQEVALLGLWRSKFFEYAAFYGGTALRILYGLDRFSEDLDFSLLRPQKKFNLNPYLKAVEVELNAMGFTTVVTEKNKRVDTRGHLIKIAVPEGLSNRIHKNKIMSIKIEVDTDPPGGFRTEAKTILQPIPFSVNAYTMPDLFAGKLHAILQRSWKKRVKGRDYYDLVWYMAHDIPVHLTHLEQRLRQSDGWTKRRSIKSSELHDLLLQQFARLDINAAKKDVLPFLQDAATVDLWSREFFASLVPRLKIL